MNLLTLLAAQSVAVETGEEIVAEVVTEAAVAEMSLWDMACKGGWIMIILALLSVVCFYIFFERLSALHKAGKDDPLFMERIRDYVHSSAKHRPVNASDVNMVNVDNAFNSFKM